MSLRFRLNLLIALVLLVISFAGGTLVIVNARRSVSEEIKSSVNLAVQLIEMDFAGQQQTDTQLLHRLNQLRSVGKFRHLKLILQQADGLPLTNIASVSTDPFTRVPEWFVWAVEPEPIRVSTQIPLSGGDFSLVIQADTADEIMETWREARVFFILIVLLAGTICALVTILVERAFRPVSVILKGLNDIEKGRYDNPLPAFSSPEFSRIAKAVNHASASLAKVQAENKALTRHSLEIQAAERQYLAQELHDEFGQSLSGIKAIAVSLKADAGSAMNHDSLSMIVASCDRLFKVVQTLMRRLHPMSLDELGLRASLEDMLDAWAGREQGIEISFNCNHNVAGCSKSINIQLFRVIQECLTNVVKHSKAGRVQIDLQVEPACKRQHAAEISDGGSRLHLSVSDDGIGFDRRITPGGFGLLSIRERVESMGGTLNVITACGKGCQIRVDVPLQSDLR